MVEIKQITAEEFLKSDNGFDYEDMLLLAKSLKTENRMDISDIAQTMIEFAKLHVQAALKAKIEAMEEHMNDGYSLDEIDSFTYNAYPLDNIK
jgi:hypothetical protein